MSPESFLTAFRRRLIGVIVTSGVARLLVVGSGVLAVAVMLDFVAPMPRFIRFAILLGLIVGLGLITFRRLLRPLSRPLNDVALARVAERRLPLNGSLFTHLDGIPLQEADQKGLQEHLGKRGLRRLVAVDEMLRAVVAAVLLMLVLGCSGYLSHGKAGFDVSIAAKRVLLPWSDAAWPRSIQLAASVERAVVAEDEPVVVLVERLRGAPAPLKMRWGVDGSRTPGDRRGPWRETLNLPPGTHEIALSSGDAEPVLVTAKVVTRPLLRPRSIEIRPPAYTGEPVVETSALEAESLVPGTEVAFTMEAQLDADRESDRLALFWGDDEVAIEREGDQVSGTLTVMESRSLVVEMEAIYAGGEAIQARPQPSYNLGIREDQPPQVRLSGPWRGEAVTPRAKVDLQVDAGDDWGLASVSLQSLTLTLATDEAKGTTKWAESEPEEQVAFLGVEGQRQVTRRHSVHVGSYASVGQQLVLESLAADRNDITGPGQGRSERLLLKVVSEEELRKELDRLLGEVRDRLTQAQEELRAGLGDAEKVVEASRNAGAIGRRTAQTLSAVTRRWRDNALEEDRQAILDQADELVANKGKVALEAAAQGGEAGLAQAREAEQILREAENLVAGLLQSVDLARDLRAMIANQKGLLDETREFVLKNLGAHADEAQQRHQENLVERQQQLAKALQDWENRLLGEEGKTHKDARGRVQEDRPGDRLERAGERLNQGEWQPGIDDQRLGLQAMEEILKRLDGGAADAELARILGDLAARQENLLRRIEDGENPADLADEQAQLNEATESAKRRIQDESDNEEASKMLGGARDAQDKAEEQLKKGSASAAAPNAGAAADMLRQAQRELEGQEENEEQKKDEEQKTPNADVLKLLRELKKEQEAVVRDVTLLHLELEEAHQKTGKEGTYTQLTFRGKRQVAPIAEAQSQVALRLRENGLKELDEQPIAKRALTRVQNLVDRATEYLKTPALGERGVKLPRLALHEINRLLSIVEAMPSPQQEEQEDSSGEAQGAQSPRAPFPPRAELGLIRAEQAELALATAAGLPIGLAERQAELKELLEHLLPLTQPGTRPNLLLKRAQRAMASAAYQLGEGARGTITRNEQDSAYDTLTRLLEEAKASGSSGQGDSEEEPEQRDSDQQQDGQQNQNQGDQGQSQAQGGAGSQGGEGQGQGGSGAMDAAGDREEDRFMHLPPKARERLREARRAELPPGAMRLYQRYLELLEDVER